MKKILWLFVLLLTQFLTSCNTTPETPDAVLSQFLEAIYQKDFAEAGEYATEESKETLILLEYGTRTNTDELNIFNPEKLDIGTAKINQNTAIVPVSEKGSDAHMSYLLVKQGNEWKVSFDNFPQIETSVTPPGAVDMDAPLDDVMDQLKDVNFDSLKREVKKDMEKRGQ